MLFVCTHPCTACNAVENAGTERMAGRTVFLSIPLILTIQQHNVCRTCSHILLQAVVRNIRIRDMTIASTAHSIQIAEPRALSEQILADDISRWTPFPGDQYLYPLHHDQQRRWMFQMSEDGQKWYITDNRIGPHCVIRIWTADIRNGVSTG